MDLSGNQSELKCKGFACQNVLRTELTKILCYLLPSKKKVSKFYYLSLYISFSIRFQQTNQYTWRHSSSGWRNPQSGSPVPEHFLTHRVVYDGPACSESESSPNEGPPYRGPPYFSLSRALRCLWGHVTRPRETPSWRLVWGGPSFGHPQYKLPRIGSQKGTTPLLHRDRVHKPQDVHFCYHFQISHFL